MKTWYIEDDNGYVGGYWDSYEEAYNNLADLIEDAHPDAIGSDKTLRKYMLKYNICNKE